MRAGKIWSFNINMNFFRFSFKREAIWMLLFSLLAPGIGLLILSIVLLLRLLR